MARPIQLRYNDAQNGETVIGTYLTDDNLINDGMLKNSGSGEYTRLEITGDKQLQQNMPIDYTSFGTAQNGESEPEILVYTYEASTGNFILRDRVFPEDAGTIKDKGTYRNDNLWGFQKWVGRQRVTGVSLSNATITEIVDALLPSGYTAVTPGGDSVPTVDNYSYTGNINGALRDIIRDYPVKIWFTANLDGNNDYEVKVESKGFGGVIQTVIFDDERQTEGYSINSFQPEDKSNIVNKVEIIGKASDGTKIQEIVDDQTSISNHGERYIKRNVGYVQDSSQATSLANSILSPDPSPHAELSIPFQEDNQLNGSVDILDDRYGIDAVYTIVKQRDFFTEGRTEVELGFEKNRTEKRRDTTRDLDERNNQLFPTSQTDVGNQSVTTGDALSNTGKNGGVGDSDDRLDNLSNVTKTGGVSSGFIQATPAVDKTFGSTTINAGTSETFTFSNLGATVDSDPAFINLNIDTSSSRPDLAIRVDIEFEFGGFNTYYHETVTAADGNIIIGNAVGTSFEGLTIDEVTLNIFNYSGQANQTLSGIIEISAQNSHSHGDDIDTNNNSMGLTDDIGTVDNNHGGGTGDDQHGGSTEDNVNVETATEDKTDR